MWYDSLLRAFEGRLFGISPPSEPGDKVFDLYNSAHPRLDIAEAAIIRRQNLLSYVQSLPECPKALLVGEAPGWRGCRFSGVPFTSESQLTSGCLPFHGKQTSRRLEPLTERSAQVFWEAMLPYFPGFFVWNSFPFHPCQENDPCSNRAPTRAEIRQHLLLLMDIWTALQPSRVFGIGRRACWALDQAGITAVYLRHPARGGAEEFRKGIISLWQSR